MSFTIYPVLGIRVFFSGTNRHFMQQLGLKTIYTS